MFKHISIENRSLDDIRENKFISRIKTIKLKILKSSFQMSHNF